MPTSLSHFLLVAAGGAIGASGRHAVGLMTLRLFGPGFPYGTLLVNILGSFAMGVLIGALALKADASQGLRLFLATGLLGGFTTFSAFSLDALSLWERGAHGAALLYVGLSVALSLAAVVAGLSLVRSIVA
ncbi:fluoride efflux transporter CrcB [Lutibaculum baratangense]|uniref:Fluoride-specific ion channel FluC n=1 Tax=Lutibaculum baratangense AMV1 TaxID=631454 RepID=V4RMP1_9HYPH|nr:fluoride efflux transporter CrcB [Lutibaculum baratangense]ESR26544.1 CrcB protein [Lutibaculum baratangense AMV1]